MRNEVIGQGLRVLRHRLGMRQADVSRRSGVSRAVLSDLERGRIEPHSVGALVAAGRAVGATVRIELRLPGGDMYRMLDAGHAALSAKWAEELERSGWLVESEVTFNHFGERGSIDLMAWHPESRVLLVVEIKTLIVDLQDLLAGLDRKVRIGGVVARQRGWIPSAVVPALVVAEGSTARRRIRDHQALFRRFELRGRDALAWVSSPTTAAPRGILSFAKLSDARSGDRRRAGRQRVRIAGTDSRSTSSDARR